MLLSWTLFTSIALLSTSQATTLYRYQGYLVDQCPVCPALAGQATNVPSSAFVNAVSRPSTVLGPEAVPAGSTGTFIIPVSSSQVTQRVSGIDVVIYISVQNIIDISISVIAGITTTVSQTQTTTVTSTSTVIVTTNVPVNGGAGIAPGQISTIAPFGSASGYPNSTSTSQQISSLLSSSSAQSSSSSTSMSLTSSLVSSSSTTSPTTVDVLALVRAAGVQFCSSFLSYSSFDQTITQTIDATATSVVLETSSSTSSSATTRIITSDTTVIETATLSFVDTMTSSDSITIVSTIILRSSSTSTSISTVSSTSILKNKRQLQSLSLSGIPASQISSACSQIASPASSRTETRLITQTTTTSSTNTQVAASVVISTALTTRTVTSSITTSTSTTSTTLTTASTITSTTTFTTTTQEAVATQALQTYRLGRIGTSGNFYSFCGGGQSWVQVFRPTGSESYVVPADGVITAARFFDYNYGGSDTGQVFFAVFRNSGQSETYSIVYFSDPVTTTLSNTPKSFSIDRAPVLQGDIIGIYVQGSALCIYELGDGSTAIQDGNPGPDRGPRQFSFPFGGQQFTINVEATLEA